MGNVLKYIPLAQRNGMFDVTIDEYDIRDQDDHWTTTLIGYVVGGTPFEQSMDTYVLVKEIVGTGDAPPRVDPTSGNGNTNANGVVSKGRNLNEIAIQQPTQERSQSSVHHELST
ncbi:hypothetical protein K7X08_034113 [Anisodus acutangulus]|uniref:Uncharacterized protein n=1 Tax=Anisodus acutangulus TaxID=402998 RepID=A0A9Q1M1Z7_9SOLA|nr:hypothetical protein K7X08_034113 [Anisodus acutangulus]